MEKDIITNKDMFNSYLEMGYNALEQGDSKSVEIFYNHAKSTLTELLKENFLRENAPKTANENLIKKYYIKQFGKFCKKIDIRNGYESFPMKTIPKRPIEIDGKILHIYSKSTLESLSNQEEIYRESNKKPFEELMDDIRKASRDTYIPQEIPQKNEQEEVLDLNNYIRIMNPEEINMRKSSQLEKTLTEIAEEKSTLNPLKINSNAVKVYKSVIKDLEKMPRGKYLIAGSLYIGTFIGNTIDNLLIKITKNKNIKSQKQKISEIQGLFSKL